MQTSGTKPHLAFGLFLAWRPVPKWNKVVAGMELAIMRDGELSSLPAWVMQVTFMPCTPPWFSLSYSRESLRRLPLLDWPQFQSSSCSSVMLNCSEMISNLPHVPLHMQDFYYAWDRKFSAAEEDRSAAAFVADIYTTAVQQGPSLPMANRSALTSMYSGNQTLLVARQLGALDTVRCLPIALQAPSKLPQFIDADCVVGMEHGPFGLWKYELFMPSSCLH